MFPTAEQQEQMLRDVAILERHLEEPQDPLLSSVASDVCCHVKALLAEVERLRARVTQLEKAGWEVCLADFPEDADIPLETVMDRLNQFAAILHDG